MGNADSARHTQEAARTEARIEEHTEHHLLAQDIVRVYTDADGNRVTALEGFNLVIEGSETVALIGPSGCGKSTFLRLVAGLDQPQGGVLTYNNAPIVGTDYRRSLVFQNTVLFDWLTIEDNIAFGLKARKVYRGQKQRVQDYIDLMGLTGFEKSYPYQISGGMASRAALARSFIQEPGILLLDEPLASLDAFTRAGIQDQIVEMQARAQAIIILVTHDIEEAIYLCDRVVVMSARPGHEIGEVSISLTHPRDRTSEPFIELRRQIMALLGS
jgi:sulfonate transport system ATP-binding protein